jgi:hypothetical protein
MRCGWFVLADLNGHRAPLTGPFGHEVAAKIPMQSADYIFIQRRNGVITSLNPLLNTQYAFREQGG